MLTTTFNVEYIADIVFLLGIVIWAIIDGKKGFISCFFSFITAIICAVVVLFLSGPVLKWTGGLFGVEGWIQDGMGSWLSTIKPFDLDVSVDGWREMLAGVALPDFLLEAVLSEIEGVVGDIPSGTLLGVYLGDVIGSFLAMVICGIALFFITKLIMILLRGLLNKAVKSVKFIQKINLIGGMIAGAFKAFAIACILLALLSLIPAEGVSQFFSNTLLLKGLYNNNPLFTVFSWFIAG